MRMTPLAEGVQIYVTAVQCSIILLLWHCSTLAGHPGERRLYNSMSTQYYWPRIANDVYGTLMDCKSCMRSLKTRDKNENHGFSPWQNLLEFIAIDLLGSLPRTRSGNRYMVVMKDRFLKLNKSLKTAITTATTVTTSSMKQCVRNIGIPVKVVANNGPQFTYKVFVAIYTQFGVKAITTAE